MSSFVAELNPDGLPEVKGWCSMMSHSSITYSHARVDMFFGGVTYNISLCYIGK